MGMSTGNTIQHLKDDHEIATGIKVPINEEGW